MHSSAIRRRSDVLVGGLHATAVLFACHGLQYTEAPRLDWGRIRTKVAGRKLTVGRTQRGPRAWRITGVGVTPGTNSYCGGIVVASERWDADKKGIETSGLQGFLPWTAEHSSAKRDRLAGAFANGFKHKTTYERSTRQETSSAFCEKWNAVSGISFNGPRTWASPKTRC